MYRNINQIGGIKMKNEEYKIYNEGIKVYKNGTVEPLNENFAYLKPRIEITRNRQRNKEFAVLSFINNVETQRRSRHSMYLIMATLFLDFNKEEFRQFRILPKDKDITNCNLDNLEIVTLDEYTKMRHEKLGKVTCINCSKKYQRLEKSTKRPHQEENLCKPCYLSKKRYSNSRKKRATKMDNKYSNINPDNSPMSDLLKDILSLRKQGHTLKEIGDMYQVSRTAIQQRFHQILNLDNLPKIFCKECGKEITVSSLREYKIEKIYRVCENHK